MAELRAQVQALQAEKVGLVPKESLEREAAHCAAVTSELQARIAALQQERLAMVPRTQVRPGWENVSFVHMQRTQLTF